MTSYATTIAEHYQLCRLIKQGGMGVVYEAVDLTNGNPCAVKLLSAPELSQHPEIVRRFFREARACSSLVSDHIVTALDSGVDRVSGVPYLVMELLQGEDLEKLLLRLGPLDPWVAVKVALQLAKGLAVAHEAGVLHRDIKPANVFLSIRESEEIVVTILDFGVAKVRVESSLDMSGALTQTGSLLGTPLYMSPEQACGASNVDARSDVWSLGAVLFEMLTGSVPFGNPGNLGTLMVSLLTEDLPLVQDRAPWVPPEIAELTHRALSRQLDHRFRDATEVRAALLEVMPSETKLYRNELAPVSSDRRSRSARRIQHLSAELVRAPRSTPVQRTHRRLRTTIAIVAAASSLGAAVALGTTDHAPSVAALTARPKKPPVVPNITSRQPEGPVVLPREALGELAAEHHSSNTGNLEPAPRNARINGASPRGEVIVQKATSPADGVPPRNSEPPAGSPPKTGSDALSKDIREFEE